MVPSTSIERNISDVVAAVSDWKLFTGKVLDLDEDEAHIHFLSHNGILHGQSKFKVPWVKDDVWISLNDIVWVTPESISA